MRHPKRSHAPCAQRSWGVQPIRNRGSGKARICKKSQAPFHLPLCLTNASLSAKPSFQTNNQDLSGSWPEVRGGRHSGACSTAALGQPALFLLSPFAASTPRRVLLEIPPTTARPHHFSPPLARTSTTKLFRARDRPGWGSLADASEALGQFLELKMLRKENSYISCS